MSAPPGQLQKALSSTEPRVSEENCNELQDLKKPVNDIFDHLSEARNVLDYQASLRGNKNHISNLCQDCMRVTEALSRGIGDSNPERHINVDHVKGLGVLQQSAWSGCALCVQFLGSDPSVTQISAEPNSQARGVVMVCPEFSYEGPAHVLLSFRFEGKDVSVLEDQHMSRIAVLPTQNTGLVKSKDISNVPIPTTKDGASTRDSISLLGEWLRCCCLSHPLCNQFDPPTAPSRLIYVGNNQIRLQVDTGGIKSYASLSHCWGKTHFQLLTRSSLGLFQSGIPVEALSKTFQDAISLVRALDIHYIWIDSLCIIQDSPEDWKAEAAKMAGVYGGATINIAASASPDGNGGLFFDRPDHWKCQIQLSGGETIYECVDQSLYYRSVSGAILSSRGWCMQERLLPPRTVFFAQDQIFWECHQREACESFPAGTPDELMHFVPPKRVIQRSNWEDIVKAYSDTKLTKETDKLVAILGVAQVVQLQTGDDYVAGLWYTGLVAQLCWRVCYGDESDESSPYRAPSWSWAALSTEVEFELRIKDTIFDVAKVMDVRKTSSGKDILHIASDFLIHADLIALRIVYKTGSEWEIVSGDTKKRLNHYKSSISMDKYLDTGEVADGMSDTLSDDNFDDAYSVESGDELDEEEREGQNETQGLRIPDFWFFRLCAHEERGKMFGLVLKSTGHVKGQYRRVGMFMWSLEDFDDVEHAFDLGENHAKEEHCVDFSVDDDGKRRIVIELM